MIRFASLGSGSSGNAMLVESDGTCLLLDCGFSVRETIKRLERLGLKPERLNGILVTHEHTDHVSGVFRMARKYALPVWLSSGTLKACARLAEGTDCRVIDCHAPMEIGGLEIFPYPVPHDAREPVQFAFSDGNVRLGVLTDCGMITPHICTMLSGCEALVLECNHDEKMLADSDYPWSLKRRIAGRLGHLENNVAASLLTQVDCSRLRHLVAAHLSERNNLPELAVDALAMTLGCCREWIGVACPKDGFAWREV